LQRAWPPSIPSLLAAWGAAAGAHPPPRPPNRPEPAGPASAGPLPACPARGRASRKGAGASVGWWRRGGGQGMRGGAGCQQSATSRPFLKSGRGAKAGCVRARRGPSPPASPTRPFCQRMNVGIESTRGERAARSLPAELPHEASRRRQNQRPTSARPLLSFSEYCTGCGYADMFDALKAVIVTRRLASPCDSHPLSLRSGLTSGRAPIIKYQGQGTTPAVGRQCTSE
jgi:hypothetical protein